MKPSAVFSTVAMASVLMGCSSTPIPPNGAHRNQSLLASSPEGGDWRKFSHLINPQGILSFEDPSLVAAGEVTPRSGDLQKKSRRNPLIDITPLTGYFDGDRVAAGITEKAFHHNAYTRLTILGYPGEVIGSAEQAAVDVRGYEERHWLRRYLVGLKNDTNLSIKMKSGNYEETISLVTLSSSSNRNGSSWNRNVTHDAINFPWFLVPRDASAPVPHIAAQYRATRAVESGAATAALEATLAAIKKVSPQASVVTKLSEPGTRDRAAAIDGIINNLFAEDINETHHSDRKLQWWRADGGIRLVLREPKDSSERNDSYQEIGTWIIGFAPPRPSLFSEWHICPLSTDEYMCKSDFYSAEKAGYLTKDAYDILKYPLVGDLTIRTWILREDWYTSLQTAFTGDQRADTSTANQLCIATLARTREIGLNGVDSALVTWAVMNALPASKAMHSAAWSAPACAAVSSKIG